MLQPNLQSPAPRRDASLPGASTIDIVFEAMGPVLVEDGGAFSFDGAIEKRHLRAIWTWLARDVAPDLLGPAGEDFDAAALQSLAPVLLARAGALVDSVRPGSDAELRLKGQLGSGHAWDRLPVAFAALKCLPLLGKAVAFGRAINAIDESGALVAALESVPRRDARLNALLMMAALGQVSAPGQLVLAATGIAGGETETALEKAGFGPLLDAILAHAQNLVPNLRQTGTFADIDLACRAIERFHRLLRAITLYVDVSRHGRWSAMIGALIRSASVELEPRLRQLAPDVSRALRRARDGVDRLDAETLLTALNGTYLLGAVRECRDSLALNEAFDEAWGRSGEVLEFHLTRTLDALREAPGDRILAERLEAGIKMAEVRFGTDYAEALRAGREAAVRRLGAA
jgi:hypothetical protein